MNLLFINLFVAGTIKVKRNLVKTYIETNCSKTHSFTAAMPVRKQASLGSKDFGLRSSLSSDDLATPGDSNATNATAGPAKKNKISVVVRKRPLNSKENGTQDILACHGNTTIIREPKLKVDLTKYTENHEYVFDQCFDEKCTNAQVYDQSVKPLVHACLVEGSKCTCFAYGQTGSG